MLDRIAWSRRSGEDVEHVIAMYLALDNPTSAEAITPSAGDAGIALRVSGYHGSVHRRWRCCRGNERSLERISGAQARDLLASRCDLRWRGLLVLTV